MWLFPEWIKSCFGNHRNVSPHTARAVCQQEEEHEVHISSATQVGMCFSPGGNLYFKHISVLELKACVFVYKTHGTLWHRWNARPSIHKETKHLSRRERGKGCPKYDWVCKWACFALGLPRIAMCWGLWQSSAQALFEEQKAYLQVCGWCWVLDGKCGHHQVMFSTDLWAKPLQPCSDLFLYIPFLGVSTLWFI